jgi:hypothetical protein
MGTSKTVITGQKSALKELKFETRRPQCIAPILFGNKSHVAGPFFRCSEKYGRVHFVHRQEVFTEECDRSAWRVSNIGDHTVGFQCSLPSNFYACLEPRLPE